MIAIAVLPFSAAAAGTMELAGDVQVIRVVNENDKTVERFEAPEMVVPGDRLIFTTRFSNGTGEIVENFVITNPIPGAVEVSEDGPFDLSVDGGETFAPLKDLSVAEAEGKRPAKLEDATHIRWILPQLEPGASGEVSYVAVVR